MTPLGQRMLLLADQGHPRAAELAAAAAAFDAAVDSSLTEPDGWARGAVHAWAKARRVWSECSGEPLV